jgi:DNA (cytosine-5)-methyltransferase 1
MPRLLDLFCCQGGAGTGYARAGFDVVGVDIEPQPRYPFAFRQADALAYFAVHAHKYQAWHASPPCQAHTNAQKIMGNYHRDFIVPTRRAFIEANRYRVAFGFDPVPWVIENVPGAPLIDPVELCGEMFGLETYRHRLFETNWGMTAPEHPEHVAKTTKMGRTPVPGEYMHVVGNFSGVDKGRQVMGMPWANRDGLREAIPPAYSEYVGRQLIDHLTREGAVA